MFQNEITLQNSENEIKQKVLDMNEVKPQFIDSATSENFMNKISERNCLPEVSSENKGQQTKILTTNILCNSKSSRIIKERFPIYDNLHTITVENKILDRHINTLHKDLYNSKYVYRNTQSSLVLEKIFQEKELLGKIIQDFEKEATSLKQQKNQVTELEKQIECFYKERFLKDRELSLTKNKLSEAQIELFNQKIQTDNFRRKIACLEQEIIKLRNNYCEKEKRRIYNIGSLKLLQELQVLREDNKKLKSEIKHLEYLKDEQNIWSSKFKNVKELKSECDLLRMQVERAEMMENQRDVLEKQVHELEACISEQENEIHRLLRHIDHLVDLQYMEKVESRLKEGS